MSRWSPDRVCDPSGLRHPHPAVARRSILRPLAQLEDVMQRLAKGQHDRIVQGTDRDDEIGAMARTVVVFRNNLIETERLRAEKLETEQRAIERHTRPRQPVRR